ncbi:hypothetical protein B0A54_17471 [Friedmanniomyces endolithicus]|uniref:Uncharacterized protein n=1 Tax=Friedmanniomyces endolithicus TaxID=329885 RepID=A0A4V5N3W5_9PEZI|nr:hypothetical protein B0A54_17471 [Friedmanniomyces endolithicus]
MALNSAIDFTELCRVAGAAIKAELDKEPRSEDTKGWQFFKPDAYTASREVKEEFEKIQPSCMWQPGVYWTKNFSAASRPSGTNFLVLQADTKEPGTIVFANQTEFPRGVYLAFKSG